MESKICHLERRWLPPMRLSQLYALYVSWSARQSRSASSWSVFHRAWKGGWFRAVQIIDRNKNTPCDQCAKYKTLRRACRTDADRAKVDVAMNNHVSSVMQDRAVINRIEAASESAARGLAVGFGANTLFCMEDGMDESKFQCPRVKGVSKALAEQWKPSSQRWNHGMEHRTNEE